MRVCPILQFNAACQAYLCINLLELLDPVRKGNDLGGTDEGEVQRVEEEDDVLALVVVQGYLLELSLDNSSSLELGGRHLWLKSHDFYLVWSLSEIK